MGMKYLIDTNVAIGFLNNKLSLNGEHLLANILDDAPLLSVVTKIEMLRFLAPPQAYETIREFVGDCTILGLEDIVVDRTVWVCRQKRIKLPDGIIAATALAHGLTLLTRNISDFKGIAGLELLDPWEV